MRNFWPGLYCTTCRWSYPSCLPKFHKGRINSPLLSSTRLDHFTKEGNDHEIIQHVGLRRDGKTCFCVYMRAFLWSCSCVCVKNSSAVYILLLHLEKNSRTWCNGFAKRFHLRAELHVRKRVYDNVNKANRNLVGNFSWLEPWASDGRWKQSVSLDKRGRGGNRGSQVEWVTVTARTRAVLWWWIVWLRCRGDLVNSQYI